MTRQLGSVERSELIKKSTSRPPSKIATVGRPSRSTSVRHFWSGTRGSKKQVIASDLWSANSCAISFERALGNAEAKPNSRLLKSITLGARNKEQADLE